MLPFRCVVLIFGGVTACLGSGLQPWPIFGLGFCVLRLWPALCLPVDKVFWKGGWRVLFTDPRLLARKLPWFVVAAMDENTLAEYMILSGADNRPPILDKDLLPPEWSKFVTDVKLVKDYHTSNFDQLHAYLEQHELHANEVRFVVLVFSPRDDLIACLNKAMAFLTVVASSRFPSTNNQLRTSTNPRNQAIIQDDRVTVRQVQERQGQNYSGGSHEAGQILDEEQLAFLADPGIPASQAETVIPHNVTFQTEDLDTYDSDCDDLSTA
ncbi:hypothetical protein Tco_0255495 [Tanacetum coccineum]